MSFAANSTPSLLHHNRQVLDQALVLVIAHEEPGAPGYARPVGAHLRHVIEHYEALLLRRGDIVDYDSRPRDGELERSPREARIRLQRLQQQLERSDAALLDVPVRVHGLCGTAGEMQFAVGSTVGRELAFVASHATHHFALLLDHCREHGIPAGADFGKAPATVAHERALRLAASPLHRSVSIVKESSCPAA
jgi:hypothetical protein